MKPIELAKLYLEVVAGFMIGSAIVQLSLQNVAASDGYWQFSQGWQNEIAFWNIGVAITLVLITRVKPTNSDMNDMLLCVVIGVVMLMAFFGGQHVVTITGVNWHLFVGILNILSAGTGLAVIVQEIVSRKAQ